MSSLLASIISIPAIADIPLNLDKEEMVKAEGIYQRYCSLCHDTDRSGYAADNAPSLRSKSLLTTGYPFFIFNTIGWGRTNTPMDAYIEEMGGPLHGDDIMLLTRWLAQVEETKVVKLPEDVIKGDVGLGSIIYADRCAQCHGKTGQGINAPSLGNQSLLANASDHFLRHALINGREGTPMKSFKAELNDEEINSVVAYLRSQASGWSPNPPKLVKPPAPHEYILNPKNEAPEFTLRDGRYVPAEQVVNALANNKRFILLDTRPGSAWQRSHIPGAVPMPYYRDKERIAEHIPNDDTWVVAYCACPHAASDFVISYLRELGYKNTAVIDEGVMVWTAMGLPVTAGEQISNN